MKPGDELRRRAAELETTARDNLDRAAQFREMADRVDALAGEFPDPESRLLLTSRQESTTLPTNMKLSIASASSVSIGRGTSKALRDGHPFASALYERGLTVSSWARSHKVKTVTALSWLNSAAGARKIPRKWAEKIEREFGTTADGSPVLPATLATWPNGITGD